MPLIQSGIWRDQIRVIPIDDEWVKNGFLDAIRRMYTPDEASVI
jgi:hypothetical protein